jgi:hypothetical protein
MERVADGPSYSEADFFLFEGLWSSWSHHGSFSSAALTEAVVKAEIARIGFRAAVEACGLFIATPASSVVYEHIDADASWPTATRSPTRSSNGAY